MTIEARKLELVNYILQIENEETLRELKSVIEDQIVLKTVGGKGLNKMQYVSEIEAAENQIKAGDFVEHDIVKSEIAQW